MSLWDELSPEEYCVMVNAVEEGHLNGVIGDYLGRAEHGGAVWIFSRDAEAIQALIPRFVVVVTGMIRRGLIEVREPRDGVWDHARPMTDTEVMEALADPDTWIWVDGDAQRMVMLMTTDHADRLMGQ
ncbi:MAG TPA: hypothetical protein VFE14_19465 [Micromonosporaceae bacterium]|nr:hypothetical protein [Micromonosporaceae bacterium]